VRRAGRVAPVAQREPVPGDVIEVDAGDAISADARLVRAAGLQTLEAPLTGESASVSKSPGVLANQTSAGDRVNSLFFGTAVVAGRGTAIVVATGMQTELGRIAQLLGQVSAEPTPLQRRVRHLSVVLAGAVLVVVAVMAGAAAWSGAPLIEVFAAAVAIAVAAIPEGLPAVLTITLALGAQRMLSRRVLIRRLAAV